MQVVSRGESSLRRRSSFSRLSFNLPSSWVNLGANSANRISALSVPGDIPIESSEADRNPGTRDKNRCIVFVRHPHEAAHPRGDLMEVSEVEVHQSATVHHLVLYSTTSEASFCRRWISLVKNLTFSM